MKYSLAETKKEKFGRCSTLAKLSLVAAAVSALGFGTAVADIKYGNVTTFDEAVPLSDTQTPDAWYPDRYRPASFAMYDFNGENVLRHEVLNADGAQNRTGGLSGGFYNTQGRKLDLPEGTDKLSVELYFPSSWEGADTRRRADLWATGIDDSDGITAYPIIGIANNDGTPVIRFWDGAAWVVAGLKPVANSWYRFDILLEGSEFVYLVDGAEVGRLDAGGTTKLRDAMLQAYNYNDTNLDAAFHENAEDYEVFWDNFSYDFSLGYDLDVLAGKRPNDLSKRKFRVKSIGYRETAKWAFGIQNSGSRTDTFKARTSESGGRDFDSKLYSYSGGRKKNVTTDLKRGKYEVTLNPDEVAVLKVETKLNARAKRNARRNYRSFRVAQNLKAISTSDRSASDENGAVIKFEGETRPGRITLGR